MGPDRARALFHGLLAGTIGFVVVAAIVVLNDVLGGRPPLAGAEGGALPNGLGPPGVGRVLGIIAYNAFTLVVFLALGVVAASQAFFAESGPDLWAASVVLFLVVLAHASAAVLLMAASVGDAILLRAAVASAILAPAAMTAHLLGARLHLRIPQARLGCARP